MISVGIDVGGTHTDLVALNSGGKIVAVDKTRTSKADVAKAIIGLIRDNFENTASDLRLIVNGTTVGTNAILERNIPEVALFTTSGFRDVLLMRRETKAELTNLQWDKPTPLVRRRNILEVDERIDYDGGVYQELDRDSLVNAISKVKDRGIRNIAVVFIHSYANPAHELIARDMIQDQLPGADVTISYEILPEWREFERTYNTVLAAALKPVLSAYVVDLDSRLREIGFQGTLEIMQANAGVASVNSIRTNPVSTLFSGVAGGVVGGMINSDPEIDKGNLITFDMGGTSTDISLVTGGRYTVTTEQELEWEGVLKFPCIDIHSIGAGGGSIAWIDEANSLHVGPRSAGAVPGPACYGTGGKDPTVTDADLVLGYLNPDNYIGGRYKLSVDRAREAIEGVSGKLGLSLLECALGIKDIVDANMVYGIRHVSVEKGNDPREYTLVAFGGAGPVHAASLMRQLGIRRTIVPLYPGNVSAAGLLGARPRVDLMKTNYVKLHDADFRDLESQYAMLEEEGLRRAAAWESGVSELERIRSMDMRYTGQTHELMIDGIPSTLSEGERDSVASMFHSRHDELYGYANAQEPIAIVNLRVTILGPRRAVNLWVSRGDYPTNGSYRKRLAVFRTGGKVTELETSVFQRVSLPPAFEHHGPAIVEEELSTTLVPPGFRFRVLEQGVLEVVESA
jgi:N-methylhydantoinase A